MPTLPPISRRRFLARTIGVAAAAGCGGFADLDPVGDARISARRTSPTSSVAPGGLALGLDAPRDGRLFIPANYTPSLPAPLLLGFHGAGSNGESWVRAMQSAADALGVVLLAPDSRARTWDAIQGPFAADVDFIDRALAHTFDMVNIDASRMAIGGFSDGATYALSIGLANGDVFPWVMAFSPGFVVAAPRHGHPRFNVQHGLSDTVLPIDACSRRIVPALQADGYDVTYTEFDGGHFISSDGRDSAFAWMLSRP